MLKSRLDEYIDLELRDLATDEQCQWLEENLEAWYERVQILKRELSLQLTEGNARAKADPTQTLKWGSEKYAIVLKLDRVTLKASVLKSQLKTAKAEQLKADQQKQKQKELAQKESKPERPDYMKMIYEKLCHLEDYLDKGPTGGR